MPAYDLRSGLLLREEIHTLFDLYLLSINPESGSICIAESIKSSYSELDGKPVMLSSMKFLDPARLKIHHMKNCVIN
ncbi:MAG: HNH endonuclease [Methylomicrobium sp.]